MDKRTISPIEISREMGLSLPTVYKLLKEQKIQYVKVGRKIIVPFDSFDKFLHNKK